MAKKNEPEVTEQKVQTRYDKKMAARKAKEERDRRDEKIFKTVTAVIGIAIVLAIVIGFGSSIVKKQTALHGTYIQVGEENISKLEFDYYYHSVVNSYLSTYGSIASYMGLDTSKDPAEQIYDQDKNLTWKDLFEEMAVQQIVSTYAMKADAQANGFTYDSTEEYESQIEQFRSAADSAAETLSVYYRETFGDYATEKNIKPFLEDALLTNAYYQELLAKNAPSEEEIKTTYEADPASYDDVDYRSFVFKADLADDATEDDIAAAMDDLKAKAEAFLTERKAGGDFNALCAENASEDDKANYEDTESDYSLKEGQRKSYAPSVIQDFLFDDTRAEGDIEVIEDTDNHQYYVVEFIKRYYDAETVDSEISDSMASDATAAYLSSLTEKFEVSDQKGHLNYLTATDSSSDSTAADGSDSTDETSDTGTAESDEMDDTEDTAEE